MAKKKRAAKRRKSAVKKIDIFPVAGMVLLIIAFLAAAIIFFSMPRNFQGDLCSVSSNESAKDYHEIARQFVMSSAEYNQYQGTNLREISERFISDNEYEYFYAFNAGNVNVSGAKEFEIKLRVLNGKAELLGTREFGSGFCGSSTFDPCLTDEECVIGGCSGQVCQSRKTEPVFTTCEYRDCYNAQQYEIICKCYQGKCRWI